MQLVTLVFMCGVFVQQTRSTAGRLKAAEVRIDEAAKIAQEAMTQSATSSALLLRATVTIDRVEARLAKHELESPCAEHTTWLAVFREELAMLRRREEERE